MILSHPVKKSSSHEDFKPFGLFRILSVWLLLCCLFILISSCAREPEALIPPGYIDLLADTVYAGEDRLVFLANGKGGYFYDDASRRGAGSASGYCRGERRLLAGWEVRNDRGELINSEPELSVIHPEYLKCSYTNGLKETIELPLHQSGLILTLKPGNKSGLFFRPVFDIRMLDEEDRSHYITDWDQTSSIFSLAREDGAGGWLAIASSSDMTYRQMEKDHITSHPGDRFKGLPDMSYGWSPGEFLVETGKPVEFIFGLGADQKSAILQAKGIISGLDSLRLARRQWSLNIISEVAFRCQNSRFEKAFAWSRLLLAQLVVEDEEFPGLLTGIPYSAFPDGWHTSLSIPGIVAGGMKPELACDILKGITDRQNDNEHSVLFGMLPGEIRENKVEYRIPLISGLAVLAYQYLSSGGLQTDAIRDDKFARVFANDLMGTSRYRLKLGLPFSYRHSHFLADSPRAPWREGATIESQVLFCKIRDFLKDYSRLQYAVSGMPESLISGSGIFTRDGKGSQLVTVGKAGEFNVPLTRESALNPFKLREDEWWADHIEFRVEGSEANHNSWTAIPGNSFAQIFALALYKSSDQRRSNELYNYAVDNELIGNGGFRSLSPLDDSYLGEHVYYSEEDSVGSKAFGDVLLWTNGIYADILSTTGRINSLWILVDYLSEMVLKQGVTGALPEAENSEPDADVNKNIVGNPVFLTSIAEYVRLVNDDVLGIEAGAGSYITLRPKFPDEWGEINMEIKRNGGAISLHRKVNNVYKISQSGIEPYVQLALEVYPESGSRALGSVRLYPGGEAQIEYVKTEKNHWKALIKRL